MAETPPQSIKELLHDLEFAVRKMDRLDLTDRVREALDRLDAKRAAKGYRPSVSDDTLPSGPMPTTNDQIVKVEQVEIQW